MVDVNKCWMLDVGCWMLDVSISVVHHQSSALSSLPKVAFIRLIPAMGMGYLGPFSIIIVNFPPKLCSVTSWNHHFSFSGKDLGVN